MRNATTRTKSQPQQHKRSSSSPTRASHHNESNPHGNDDTYQIIDALLPNSRKSSMNRQQLALDIKHLMDGTVNCILFDYLNFDSNAWKQWYKEKKKKQKQQLEEEQQQQQQQHSSILSILKITFPMLLAEEEQVEDDKPKRNQVMHFYYLIHTEHFKLQLHNWKQQLNAIHFVNVDPSLSEPCLIEQQQQQQYEYVIDCIQSMNERILSSLLDQSHHLDTCGIIHVNFAKTTTNAAEMTTETKIPIIDTCMLNGWLLEYPFIYVHGHLFPLTISSIAQQRDNSNNNNNNTNSKNLQKRKKKKTATSSGGSQNCLSMIPLYLFQVLHPKDKSIVRQFTAPVCVVSALSLQQDVVQHELPASSSTSSSNELLKRLEEESSILKTFLSRGCQIRSTIVEQLSIML